MSNTLKGKLQKDKQQQESPKFDPNGFKVPKEPTKPGEVLRAAIRALATEIDAKFNAEVKSISIVGTELIEAILDNATDPRGSDEIAKYLLLRAGLKGQYFTVEKATETIKKDPTVIPDIIVNTFLLPMLNKGKARKGEATGTGDLPDRDGEFKTKLLQRDQLLCAATGRADRKCKPFPVDTYPVRLEGAHIIPRTIYNIPETVNFIQSFAGNGAHVHLTSLDTPQNGMLLQIDAHRDFDDYLWGVQYSAGAYRAYKITNVSPGISFEVPEDGSGRLMTFKSPETIPEPVNPDQRPRRGTALQLVSPPAAELFQLHYAFGCILRDLKLLGV